MGTAFGHLRDTTRVQLRLAAFFIACTFSHPCPDSPSDIFAAQRSESCETPNEQPGPGQATDQFKEFAQAAVITAMIESQMAEIFTDVSNMNRRAAGDRNVSTRRFASGSRLSRSTIPAYRANAPRYGLNGFKM